jgi:hypothetical protein
VCCHQHSGVYARAHRHLELLLTAAAADTLDVLPPADVRDLYLLDALRYCAMAGRRVMRDSRCVANRQLYLTNTIYIRFEYCDIFTAFHSKNCGVNTPYVCY